MPRRHERLLDVHPPVAEGRFGFRRRGAVRVLEIGGVRDEPHPLAAAARRRLEEQREADVGGDCEHVVE